MIAKYPDLATFPPFKSYYSYFKAHSTFFTLSLPGILLKFKDAYLEAETVISEITDIHEHIEIEYAGLTYFKILDKFLSHLQSTKEEGTNLYLYLQIKRKFPFMIKLHPLMYEDRELQVPLQRKNFIEYYGSILPYDWFRSLYRKSKAWRQFLQVLFLGYKLHLVDNIDISHERGSMLGLKIPMYYLKSYTDDIAYSAFILGEKVMHSFLDYVLAELPIFKENYELFELGLNDAIMGVIENDSVPQDLESVSRLQVLKRNSILAYIHEHVPTHIFLVNGMRTLTCVPCILSRDWAWLYDRIPALEEYYSTLVGIILNFDDTNFVLGALPPFLGRSLLFICCLLASPVSQHLSTQLELSNPVIADFLRHNYPNIRFYYVE